MKVTAVIMAGGKGERFWPRSRSSLPKQFLSLTDDGKTMIQHTVERLLPLVEMEDVFVVTNERYRELVQQQLPDMPKENILCEPMARNTAPCVAFAAGVIHHKYDDAIMLVLPSDHLIKLNEMYIDTLEEAIDVAKQGDNLVTMGITPAYPETGYGYINFGDSVRPGVYRVNRFVEKPDLATAKEYLASGQYLWNSGMFVWKVSAILHNFQTFLPDMYVGALKIRDAFGTGQYEQVLTACFEAFESVSIDYGIMERAQDIFTLPGNFGWDDVGSWLSLERINRTNELGNVIQGDVITVDTHNCIVCGNKKLIAAVGLEDLVVVDTDDAILICTKDHTQDVKKVIENLKICNRDNLI